MKLLERALTSSAGMVLRWGGGTISPNLSFPQMWHETLLDELKASTYRCKKERSVAYKIRQKCVTRWGSSRRFPDPLDGWWGDRGHTPHTAPHGDVLAFGASHFGPSFKGVWPKRFYLEPCLVVRTMKKRKNKKFPTLTRYNNSTGDQIGCEPEAVGLRASSFPHFLGWQ